MAATRTLQVSVALVAMTACGLVSGQMENGTLLELADFFGAAHFTKLATMVGMEDVLKQPGNLSLFAFVDKAWDDLPQAEKDTLTGDTILLKTVLQGHVVTEVISTSNLGNEKKLPSLDSGHEVRINVYNHSKVITASGARQLLGPRSASNGNYYSVDRLIYPPYSGTALDLVTEASNFDLLLLALIRAQLSSELEKDPLTLFAPNDDAFAKLPPEELDKMMNDPALLKSVLEYHVVANTYYSAGLQFLQNVTTVLGKSLPVSVTNTNGTVGTAQIVSADLRTSNGVVHIIDSVLMPPSLSQCSTCQHHGT